MNAYIPAVKIDDRRGQTTTINTAGATTDIHPTPVNTQQNRNSNMAIQHVSCISAHECVVRSRREEVSATAGVDETRRDKPANDDNS